MSLCDIIVVTWNLPEYAVPCIQSILAGLPDRTIHVYLVNNGRSEHNQYFPKSGNLTIIQTEENLGWEGGLKAGLKYSAAPYVIFMNDDTYVPPSSQGWVRKMMRHFADPACGAVGPTSNVVMGSQNIFCGEQKSQMANFLIGFCVMVRRSDLDACGGVDDSLPGGDDLDLSIRLRKLGKFLICDREVFIYHHGFKSGERKNGADYNSIAAIERTNFALIKKHGLRSFQNLWSGPAWDPDQEGKLIASLIGKDEKTVDLGCGTRRTVPWAVGYDAIPRGTFVPNVFPKGTSVADHVCDVTKPLPIDAESQDVVVARHVLEHVENVDETLKNWGTVLKHGGKLIVAVPNDDVGYTESMDHDHKQAFTPETLRKALESNGFKVKDMLNPKNDVSFVAVAEKNGLLKA